MAAVEHLYAHQNVRGRRLQAKHSIRFSIEYTCRGRHHCDPWHRPWGGL